MYGPSWCKKSASFLSINTNLNPLISKTKSVTVIPNDSNQRLHKMLVRISSDLNFITKWSHKQNIIWVTFDPKNPVLALYQRHADLGRNKIRLIGYTLHWV